MNEALTGNGHPATLHSEFVVSPRSAANLLKQFRYRLQNNRRVQRAAHYIQEHSPRDVAAAMDRVVRQRPAAALAVAAVAGFLLGRSMRRR